MVYAETVCVDRRGVPEKQRMRCDNRLHPQHAHLPQTFGTFNSHTRLAGKAIAVDHDDWDCIEDMAREGLIEIGGTGLHPIWRLTDEGWKYAHSLRRARAERDSKWPT